LRTLIIAKPSAVNERMLGAIIQRVEDAGLRIEGIKASILDVHNLKQKATREKNNEKINEIDAALKVPCVLISAAGKNAIIAGEKIKDEFGDKVHTSSNEEVAKYEIARFFTDEELFEYSENDFAKILGTDKAPVLWRKFKEKSVEEIEKEAKKEKKEKK